MDYPEIKIIGSCRKHLGITLTILLDSTGPKISFIIGFHTDRTANSEIVNCLEMFKDFFFCW